MHIIYTEIDDKIFVINFCSKYFWICPAQQSQYISSTPESCAGLSGEHIYVCLRCFDSQTMQRSDENSSLREKYCNTGYMRASFSHLIIVHFIYPERGDRTSKTFSNILFHGWDQKQGKLGLRVKSGRVSKTANIWENQWKNLEMREFYRPISIMRTMNDSLFFFMLFLRRWQICSRMS